MEQAASQGPSCPLPSIAFSMIAYLKVKEESYVQNPLKRKATNICPVDLRTGDDLASLKQTLQGIFRLEYPPKKLTVIWNGKTSLTDFIALPTTKLSERNLYKTLCLAQQRSGVDTLVVHPAPQESAESMKRFLETTNIDFLHSLDSNK